MITALAFDMTGVITRSPIHMLEDYGDSLGLPKGTLAGFFRTTMFEDVLLGRAPMNSLIDDIISTIRHSFGVDVERAALYEAMRASRVIDPLVASLIDELRPHYRMAVLTNNTNDVLEASETVGADWWSDDEGQRIGPSDFDFVMSSSELGLTKPDPRIYAELIRRLGVPAGQIAYIDDTAANLPPAEALGMSTIEYHNVDQCRNALSAIGVRSYVSDWRNES